MLCAISAASSKAFSTFFLFLLQPLTALMKQTWQAVFAIEQCIFLRCLWCLFKRLLNKCLMIKLALSKSYTTIKILNNSPHIQSQFRSIIGICFYANFSTPVSIKALALLQTLIKPSDLSTPSLSAWYFNSFCKCFLF